MHSFFPATTAGMWCVGGFEDCRKRSLWGFEMVVFGQWLVGLAAWSGFILFALVRHGAIPGATADTSGPDVLFLVLVLFTRVVVVGVKYGLRRPFVERVVRDLPSKETDFERYWEHLEAVNVLRTGGLLDELKDAGFRSGVEKPNGCLDATIVPTEEGKRWEEKCKAARDGGGLVSPFRENLPGPLFIHAHSVGDRPHSLQVRVASLLLDSYLTTSADAAQSPIYTWVYTIHLPIRIFVASAIVMLPSIGRIIDGEPPFGRNPYETGVIVLVVLASTGMFFNFALVGSIALLLSAYRRYRTMAMITELLDVPVAPPEDYSLPDGHVDPSSTTRSNPSDSDADHAFTPLDNRRVLPVKEKHSSQDTFGNPTHNPPPEIVSSSRTYPFYIDVFRGQNTRRLLDLLKWSYHLYHSALIRLQVLFSVIALFVGAVGIVVLVNRIVGRTTSFAFLIPATSMVAIFGSIFALYLVASARTNNLRWRFARLVAAQDVRGSHTERVAAFGRYLAVEAQDPTTEAESMAGILVTPTIARSLVAAMGTVLLLLLQTIASQLQISLWD